MKRIYKYILEEKQTNTLRLPIDSKILSAKEQYGEIVIYVLINTDTTEYEDIDIKIYGTGHDVDIDLENWNFLDTVKLADGHLMFHIFYSKN